MRGRRHHSGTGCLDWRHAVGRREVSDPERSRLPAAGTLVDAVRSHGSSWVLGRRGSLDAPLVAWPRLAVAAGRDAAGPCRIGRAGRRAGRGAASAGDRVHPANLAGRGRGSARHLSLQRRAVPAGRADLAQRLRHHRSDATPTGSRRFVFRASARRSGCPRFTSAA